MIFWAMNSKVTIFVFMVLHNNAPNLAASHHRAKTAHHGALTLPLWHSTGM
jgi:hypothetical protein